MECDSPSEVEEKKSDYKPVEFEEVRLAPLVPPIGYGYTAFSDVLHWIVTKGGTVEVEPKFDDAWTNGLTELMGLVATGKLQVIGENARTGMAEVIPHLNFASPLVESPFSLTDDERCDLVMSRKMILWLSRDELSQRPGDKWEHLRIDKEEVRDWWPIPEKVSHPIDLGITLPKIVPPSGGGFIPLFSAAHWIATECGTVEVAAKWNEAWDGAFTKLLALFSTGAIKVVGIHEKRSRFEIIDPLNFVSVPVDDPFSMSSLARLLGEEMALHPSPHTDELVLDRVDRWTSLQVKASDILDRWPIPDASTSSSVIHLHIEAAQQLNTNFKGQALSIYTALIEVWGGLPPRTLKSKDVAAKLRPILEARGERFPKDINRTINRIRKILEKS